MPVVMSLVGETVELVCPARGNPPVERTWRRGEMVLQSGGRVALIGQTLRIASAQESDTGLYNCTVSNLIDFTRSDSTLFQLIIQSKFL